MPNVVGFLFSALYANLGGFLMPNNQTITKQLLGDCNFIIDPVIDRKDDQFLGDAATLKRMAKQTRQYLKQNKQEFVAFLKEIDPDYDPNKTKRYL